MEKLRNTRILGAIGIIALFLGVILPYYQINLFGYSYKITLWGYLEGKIVMILAVANFLFIFKDLIEKYVPQMFNSNLGRKIQNANPKFSIIPTILIVAFVVILFFRLDIDTTLNHGLGFYTLWFGVICLILHTFIYKKSNVVKDQQYNYNSNSTNSNVTILNCNEPANNMVTNQPANVNVKCCPYCGNQCDQNVNQCFMCGKQI